MTTSVSKQISFLVFSFIASFLSVEGQDENKTAGKRYEKRILETYQDCSFIADRKNRLTSKAYKYSGPTIVTTQVNINAQGLNILGDAANEPSIVFDPNDPDKMAIGWRQFDTIGSNFRQAGCGYTTDGGQTWIFPGVIDQGVFRSDPVLKADMEGNFYFNSLTMSGPDLWCDVFKSSDGGQTWDNGTFAFGGDKQWMSIDNTSGNIYVNWSSAGICPPDIFTRSTDHGYSYEECSLIPGDPYWGTSAINKQGVLYVCGAQNENFVVAKSSNARYQGQPVSWDSSITVSLDGHIVSFAGITSPNPAGLLGQAAIVADTGNSFYNGNLYLICSVERPSIPDPCDLMFSVSNDGGQSWSSPIRINNDLNTDAWQWFGTISVAANGRIDVVWLDTRDHPGTLLSTLYYCYSNDGGNLWSDNFSLSESFDPHLGWPQQMRMGDYFDMFSDNEGVHLAWSATFNGEQDIFYSYIKPHLSGVNDKHGKEKVFLYQSSPNPCSDFTTISWFIPEKLFVSLNLIDLFGKKVKTIVNEIRDQGRHEIKIDVSDLKNGIYIYSLKAGGFNLSGKLTIIN